MKPRYSLRVAGNVLRVASLCLILWVIPARSGPSIDDMAETATRFLAALNPEQKAKAQFPWKSDERFNWHFIPKERNGLTFKEMTTPQRQLAQSLMASALSQRGFIKATTIMSLEQVLQELEGPNRRFARDPEMYHVSIFGTPSPKTTWGWRVEGHHLALNFTIIEGQSVSVTPSFFGTNPAEVKTGPRQGLRVLAAEEDLGRQLVTSLIPEQLTRAVISEKAPSEILTEAIRKAAPLEEAGLPATELTPKQMGLLKQLIEEYVRRYRTDVADADLKKIQAAGMNNILFAWAGSTEKGEGHYYRVQGPTFLLEYDCTQNQANHIHAVWRDFDGDFGEDLLKKHYQEVPHP